MENYTQYTVKLNDPEVWNEIYIATIADFEFESIEESPDAIHIYSLNKTLDNNLIQAAEELKNLQPQLHYEINSKEIPYQNWNKEWEKNFPPVWIEDWCVIRAPFHQISAQNLLNIVILPKMSFGTGHHPTTYLMLNAMKRMELQQKRVLDMGAGTGILSIAAKKMGAQEVYGVEIEEWSHQNAIENAKINAVEIHNIMGSVEEDSLKNLKFDVILANINKNILIEQVKHYRALLNKNGTILVSGLLSSDQTAIENAFKKYNFLPQEVNQKNNWICIKFYLD